MHCQYMQEEPSLRFQNVNLKMVPFRRNEGRCAINGEESSEDREERILAMLGIIGTVLNLLVVIFVYIYTTI
ncbi:hypothetical protein AOXY_G28457 [Acipenser oxyrinchus oxyrinchus]|uniref:TCL1 upstream neural differentiation-associated RNA n=1 Tax=Acipenser oxyrinchus oxyrinchus TaxID=40147 RepID=A0AAD8CQ45_ACIOX|nr:hypothetical protein AOXY_G28457 [Acipenser oxyrinchus oxyrinchus]